MADPGQVEFDGAAYARASAHQTDWGHALIDDLELQGTERVLDLGCGDGRLTAELARRVPQGGVLGIDSAPDMIRSAEDRAGGNLAFRLQAIETLDADARFDVIFSNATLHWIHDHTSLLERIRRALRPGGLVRLNFGADGNCGTLVRVLRDAMQRPAFAEALADFTFPWFLPRIDAYTDRVARAGFSTHEVWGTPADRVFPDRTALIGWIDQPCLIPFLRHLPAELHAPFRESVVARMVEETGLADGGHAETFRRVNVRAYR